MSLFYGPDRPENQGVAVVVDDRKENQQDVTCGSGAGPKSARKTNGLCCERAFRPTPTWRSGPPALQKNHLVSLDNVPWRATGLRRRVGAWFAWGS